MLLPRLTALALALALPNVAAQATTSTICASDAFKALKPSPLGASPLTIRALVVEDQVCLEFALAASAPSDTEWFAVGVAATAAMVNSPHSNVMVFQKAVGQPESYSIAAYSSSAVTKESDQSFFVVHEASTAPLTYSYQRSLAAASEFDVAIDPSVEANFIWAYGSSWPIAGHRTGTKGTEKYNFVTGASATTEKDFCEDHNCPAVIGGAAFLLMALGGFVISVLLRQTPLGHAMLYKMLGSPPVKSTTNASIASPLNMLLQNIADLRLGEVLVMLIFIGAAVALVILNVNESDAVTSGQVALLVLMFLILPVSRVPVWTILFGSSFERMVKFHRWLGMVLSVVTLVHLIQATKVVDLISTDKYGDVVPLFGYLAFMSYIAIALTANEFVRRKFFDVFYMSHRVLSIVGFVFTILHATKKVGPAIAVPLVLYAIGLMIQWVQQYSTIYQATVTVHEPTNTTTMILTANEKTVHFAQHMNHCAYFWVKVPTVSGTQWHPFSAIVTPSGESIAFCMRALSAGNTFTRQLLEQAKQSHSLAVRLSGPYGKISVDVDNYDVIILVGGGVGVTPLLSVLNQRRLFAPKTAKATDWNILWSVRNAEDLLMADALMPSRGQADYTAASTPNLLQDPYQPFNATTGEGAMNITWNCHCSAEKQDGVTTRANGEEMAFRGGIPVLDEYINTSRYAGRKVAVLVCGPPTMVVEAQSLARKCGFDFHKEVFNW